MQSDAVNRLRQMEDLSRLLPESRLVDDPEEIRRLQKELLGDCLFPILAQNQPQHVDYYCLDFSSGGAIPKIVVFAEHAAVHEWSSLGDWIAWIEQLR